MNEDQKEFLESMDGQKRDLDLLVKLASPQGRLDYAVSCIANQKEGMHRYRALFDEAYRKRSNPGKERIDELDEEFKTLKNSYHKQALIYYNGPMSDEEITKAIEQDEQDIKDQLLQGMGGPPMDEDEFDLGLNDWQKE